MTDNISSYQTIGWILNHSDNGFYSLIASEFMQSKVAGFYEKSNIAVYDYRLNQEDYTFQALKDRISNEPDKDAYFLLNFQRALSGEEMLKRLNFSRDMLQKLNKNIIFCMTQSADNLLNKKAYDFYSYIKLVVVFRDEFIEMPEKLISDSIIAKPQARNQNDQTDIEHYEQWPEEKQLAYAISLSNHAKKLIHDYCFHDAKRLLETVLKIRIAIWGTEHPDTGAAYNNIATIYQAQQKYSNALEFYQKALAIFKNTLGTKHPTTGTAYNNIASIYEEQGEYSKAMEFYQKALSAFQVKSDLHHPDTENAQNQIRYLKNMEESCSKLI